MKHAPGEVTVSIHYARHLGPRYEQAGVTLRFEVAPTFAFVSEAVWPDADYTAAVRDGLESGFKEHAGDLPGARVVLEQVVWHEVDSSVTAFKQAARAAVVTSLTV